MRSPVYVLFVDASKAFDRLSHIELFDILQGTKRITGQYSLLRTSAPQEVLVRTGQHWSVPVSTGPYILGRPMKFSNSQDADNTFPMTPGSLTP